ncbi:MAG: T9SS type A sorting domain-containing protein [Bacteroidia bacterium]|nr:T9SS type A sorting domain-containing protein [Bacteroidia bacterium]
MTLRIAFALLFSFLVINLQAQLEDKYQQSSPDLPDWVSLMYSDSPDPGAVTAAYEGWYKTHPFVKNSHTQYYKRWLRMLGQDVKGLWTTGANLREIEEREAAYLQQCADVAAGRGPSSPWSSLGPWDWDHDAASRSYAPGAAHVYTVEQSLANSSLLFAGTATTGIWKSTDKGTSWSLTTRNMIINGSLAVELDWSNVNIAYFGGGGNLYKTTNQGTSWISIGDAPFQALNHDIKDIVMHPSNSQVLYVCSNQGFFKSTDGGANFTQLMSGSFQEFELHPSNSNIQYVIRQPADKTEFYKSTDNGATWVIKTQGWPNPASGDEQKRTEIAVTSNAPNMVYALATGAANGGSGLYGIYVSTDAGETWARRCCGPQEAGVPSSTNMNLMGWSDQGTDDGGQYYYDLALAVDPANSLKVDVCGVNHWVSTDGGYTFTCPSKWSTPDKSEYVHADIHDVRYYGNDLWFACDGGIFYSSDGGDTIIRKLNGIEGTDFWGFGAGFIDGDVMLGGTYHNGTLLKDGNTYLNGWICTQGGDNYRGFVNFGDSRTVYHDGGGKILPGDRTIAIAGFPFNHQPNATYTTGASSQIEFDPRCYNMLYSGEGTSLWRSFDNGSSYELVKDFGENVTSVEVSWADPDRIYVATYKGWWDTKRLWRTTDQGTNWTEITPSSTILNGNTWVPYDITVDAKNADKLWIARTSQYGNSPGGLAGYEVFKSTDGGSTWINWSSPSLAGEYPSCIEHHRGTNGGVYLGTRRAVWYRNDNMSAWALFNNNLPVSTSSVNLVPYYWGGKLRNGTNRSVYEVDFYETAAPTAQIAADRRESYCTRDTVYYTDHSSVSQNGATWSWSFPGGNPSTSNLRQPKVVYSSPGTYDVSLTVSDVNGSDSQTLTNFLTVTSECEPDTVPGLALSLTNSGDYASIPPLGITTNTITFSAWVKPNGVQPEYTGIVMHGSTAAGLNVRPSNELGYHWPGGAWWWSSGLLLPQSQWSHVVLVVEPTQVTVYLNGVGSTHVVNTAPVAFDAPSLIGSYQGWGSRNWKGQIDEVCIWNRALTQAEVRELRHLTKIPSADPTLLAYYQFNRPSGVATDRAHIYHANLNGAATRVTSTGPFGGGNSSRQTVSTGGPTTFGGTGVTLGFSPSGTNPDGELVVTRINLNPDQAPNTDPISRSYWVVNNYGVNSTFTALDSIRFERVGPVTVGEAASPSAFKLYKRGDNAFASSWGTLIDQGDYAKAGADGDVTFSNGNGIGSFSQFVISNSGAPLGLDYLEFTANLQENRQVRLNWSTEGEEGNDYFAIDRSSDGQNFQEIGQVKSKGNSTGNQNYQTWDPEPQTGLNYYRLRIIDLKGNTSYSEVRTVYLGKPADEVFVYPNPAEKGKGFTILLGSPEGAALRLWNVNGQIIREMPLEMHTEISTSDLEAGPYFYEIMAKTYRKNGVIVLR